MNKTMTITNPRIESADNAMDLIADIIWSDGHEPFRLRYSVEPEYGQYLCTEVADCFLLAVLPYAVRNGLDIVSEAPVSSRFLFNIYNALMPVYQIILGGRPGIRIMADADATTRFEAKGVGCGCSLGVDSLASIWAHMSDDVPPDYRLTHLAIFNCGQMGDRDAEKAAENFKKGIADAQAFAARVNLPLVHVDSNVTDLYVGSGISIMATINQRTISCAMALQKLFGKYVFASSYYYPQYKFKVGDAAPCEEIEVPAMGTNSFQPILSGAKMTRIEKEMYIDQFELTHEFLNCCAADQMAYLDGGGNPIWLEGKTKKNCGWCDKCLRTLLAYDVMHKLDAYEGIFDIAAYRKHKAAYIRKCFLLEHQRAHTGELVELMLREHYPVPAVWRAYRFVMNGIRGSGQGNFNVALAFYRKIRKTFKR